MIAEALREFNDGVAYWSTRPQWDADLHNCFYRTQAADTDGTFSPEWWGRTRQRLYGWRATRGARFAELDARFEQHRDDLVTIWTSVIQPRLDDDITSIAWEDVQVLPELCVAIKPTRTSSGVFPSKLSHFIAPRLFPVLDKTALPGGQLTYCSYFNLVKTLWGATTPADQDALRASLITLIQDRSGDSMFSGYPTVNKIVELRLIGRRHPSTAAPSR